MLSLTVKLKRIVDANFNERLAFEAAFQLAKKGETVLAISMLWQASTYLKAYEDRGRQFKECVNNFIILVYGSC